LAIQFLTRIPVTIKGVVDEKKMARSMAWFSLAGLLLGAAAAVVHALASFAFPLPVSNILTLVFLVFITGNMHGDGLMDSADGLFSGKPRERVLEIMKDSRVGSHGVMAGILVILAKYVLLGQAEPGTHGIALILMVSLARWSQVYGAALYSYARLSGGVGIFTAHVGRRELLINLLTILAVTLFLLKLPGLILLGTVFAGTALLHWLISKKLAGITGDTLGAVSECIEVLCLLTFIAI